jgi:glycosyltransferase involved in cell wall biosynthesis
MHSLWIPGGAERMTTLIAGELVRRGVRVDIVCINGGEPFFELDPRIGVVALNPERDNNFYRRYVRNVWRLHLILRRQKYDWLINVCTAWSLVSIPAALGTGTRVISWEHMNALERSSRLLGPLSRRLSALFARKVVVLTDDDKVTYEKKFGARNVVKIPNPVTIEVDEPSPLRDKRFLAIGRFSHEKGFDMLLDAWALTRCRHEGWKLRVVGSGILEGELAARIERLAVGGSVALTPTVSDVRDIYRHASVLVMSSRNEGMPLVLIEAMAMGLPIVSFDCEAGPRNVVVDGVTGKLVPPEDVVALAAAMDDMAADKTMRSRMSAAALERSRFFSPEAIMERWMDLLING